MGQNFDDYNRYATQFKYRTHATKTRSWLETAIEY